MKKLFLFCALVGILGIRESFSDAAHRYSVEKVEVQSGVPTFGGVVSSNRTVVRARLIKDSTPLNVWFDLLEADDMGKIKLSIFMAAVASGKKVEITITETVKGSIHWAQDDGPTWSVPIFTYCDIAGLSSL